MASKVVLAYPYTDANGKDHKPDSTVSVADDEAARLVAEGLARRPEDDAEEFRAPTPPPAKPAETTTK